MLHFIAIWHKVQHTIIRKLDYIAAGGIINMVNMVNMVATATAITATRMIIR